MKFTEPKIIFNLGRVSEHIIKKGHDIAIMSFFILYRYYNQSIIPQRWLSFQPIAQDVLALIHRKHGLAAAHLQTIYPKLHS